MTFRTGQSISAQYEKLKAFVNHLKIQAVRHREQTRDIKTVIDGLLSLLNEAESRLASTPSGIVAYAQQQEDDNTYDISTELSELLSKVTAVKVWITSNIPTSVDGTVNERVLNPNGSTSLVQLTAPQALALAGKIQTIIDVIG